jgi:transcriptional regulator with XRE-family HTH domain
VKPIRRTKDLGALIRARRKALGLTLEDASGMCDVGVRFLFELESGKSTCQIGKVFSVAERFGVDIVAIERAPAGASPKQ